jgi:hypothetical protein
MYLSFFASKVIKVINELDFSIDVYYILYNNYIEKKLRW